MADPVGAENFLGEQIVSRETFQKLQLFAELLTKWNPAAGLVSPASLGQLWDRHILDSAQLLEFAPGGARKWLDIGSGGGFPGLVCAIIAVERRPQIRFMLVDSNRRKCDFLSEVCRQTGTGAEVLNIRAEQLDPGNADVVSARAVAPLHGLLPLARRHLAEGGLGVFPKGSGYRDELTVARNSWSFTVDAIRSRTDSSGRVLLIGSIVHG